MPRPSETREPTEILKEFEGSVKALRELLEGSPGLFELNMGLSIAQGLQKTSGKLSKRIESKLRQTIFEEGEKYGRATKTVDGNGKRPIRVNLKKHKT